MGGGGIYGKKQGTMVTCIIKYPIMINDKNTWMVAEKKKNGTADDTN